MAKIKFSKTQLNQFKKIGVETVYLFGSQAKDQTHALSDFDFGVILNKPEKYANDPLNTYSQLYSILVDILPKAYLRKRFQMRAHEFDLVFLQFAPIDLQFEAMQNSKILYEKNQEKRLDYEENILKKYADLKYFYDLSYKNLLERL